MATNSPSLFESGENAPLPPLAERVRPTTLEDFIGHDNLVGEGHLLHSMAESGNIFSLLLWGPPGSGKTTLAKLLAGRSNSDYHELSAVSAGVKDVRAILNSAASGRQLGKTTLLFIDEIHRFNKAQQDALLHAVEDGTITLIGATTENPSFEVISALLSRCRVIKLQPYSPDNLSAMLDRALAEDIVLRKRNITIPDEVRMLLTDSAGGDARKMYNALEIALGQRPGSAPITLTENELLEALQQKNLLYDRAGDYHYDTISAFIKSLRGSDPDASIYWMALMLEGGEKPEFIARRMVILASEDVGNADPRALLIASSGMTAIHQVGMPEAAIILAQICTYLACAPKSNASYMAIKKATAEVKESGVQNVPLHLRNSPTKLMADMDYGKGYVYPHDQPDHFTKANYFPDDLKSTTYYAPADQGYEQFIRERMAKLWPDRY